MLRSYPFDPKKAMEKAASVVSVTRFEEDKERTSGNAERY